MGNGEGLGSGNLKGGNSGRAISSVGEAWQWGKGGGGSGGGGNIYRRRIK